MKVTDHLNEAKGTLFSFEVLPSVKGKDIKDLYEGIEPLLEFDPKFINVTYHREEYVYKRLSNGLHEKIMTRKRPGTVSICAAIKYKYGVDTVPHLICGGFTRQDTELALLDMHYLGMENVLALRGDPVKGESMFIPEKDGHATATTLVKQVAKMNQGKYLDDDLVDPIPTDFCIGVAGYPEKHFEAQNLKSDMRYLKQKVDAGAHYIVTQMFFDNQKFFNFVDACRKIGINVPIIPGLKPITTTKHISFLPKTFHIDMPEELADELENCKSNEEVAEIGIEWCIKQVKELMKAGVPCVHFYTMGKSEAVKRIAKACY
ncbi:MAG: methylenetetrahydrofolate reductase [NAD(P)H] [Flavobacteriales bacterium]